MAGKRVLCEPCLFIETEIEAVGFCVTCAECLCSKCLIDHRKTKVTRNHEVHKVSIPDNADVIKEMNEMLACPVHNEMKISYRCNDHSVCICTVCRIDTHRNCERVVEIAKSEADGDIVSVKENLEDLTLYAASLQERKEKNRNVLNQTRSEILSEQEVIIQKAKNTLEELKSNLAKETDEHLQTAFSDIDKDIESIEVIKQSAKKHLEILEASKRYGDNANPKVIEYMLAGATVKQREVMNDLNKKAEYKLLFVKNEDCLRIASPGTTSLILDDEKEVKQECVESGIEKTSDEVVECEQSTSALHATSTIVKARTYCMPTVSENFSFVKQEISVRSHTDAKRCSINGISVLAAGGLVIIDTENSNIKLLSSDYILLHVLRLPGKPIRMCPIGKDKFAVSFGRVKRINRYSVVGNNILYDGGFATTLFNHGLAFDGKSIVAIMCDEDFSSNNNAKEDTIQIEFRNPFNGIINNTIKDFKVEGHKSWSLTLNDTNAIQFTDDNSMIILELNRILRFGLRTHSCKTVAIEKDYYVCKGENEKEVMQNFVIDDKSVFVCTDSGDVLQLSTSDYSNNRVIASETDSAFYSIAIDPDNGRMILGCDERDELLIYKFKKNT